MEDWYLAFTHHVQDMPFEPRGLSGQERCRGALWWREWLNAVAPKAPVQRRMIGIPPSRRPLNMRS